MRNKILKLAFRFSAFAFAVGMTGCDALDLAPIDTYGSGNFWTRKEHVIAYMDGIHKNFRDQIFQQQYLYFFLNLAEFPLRFPVCFQMTPV